MYDPTFETVAACEEHDVPASLFPAYGSEVDPWSFFVEGKIDWGWTVRGQGELYRCKRCKQPFLTNDHRALYCSNRCWAKSREKLLTVNGVTRTVPEWAELQGISTQMIHRRLYRGFTPERAITPGRVYRRTTQAEIARELGVSEQRVHQLKQAGQLESRLAAIRRQP